MTESNAIVELVERVPELDTVPEEPEASPKKRRANAQREGKLTGPDWETAKQIFDPILAAGPDGCVQVIDLLQEVDDGSDYKARYVLHGLAVYVGRPGAEEQRKMFAQTLASQLGGHRPKAVQGFVVRELQVAGRREVVDTLGSLLVDEDLYVDAAAALLAIRDGAAKQFRGALSAVKGHARLTIIQALDILGEAASVPAPK